MPGPKMVDERLYRIAGINPHTGLPNRHGGADDVKEIVENISKSFSVIDQTQYINRYKWGKLPVGLQSDLLELMIYHKYTLAGFRYADQVFALPYALNGDIDIYGRYLGIEPLPFAGPMAKADDNGKVKPFVKDLKLIPIYSDSDTLEDVDFDPDKNCILLYDYSKPICNLGIPRADLNRCYINMESEFPSMMRTSCIAGTGTRSVRIDNESEAPNVTEASHSIIDGALTGETLIPVVGKLDFQDLSNKPTLHSEEYMMAMRSVDNLRLASMGIDNGGMFEKNGTMLKDEHGSSHNCTQMMLDDGLMQRQRWANQMNTMLGTEITCEINIEQDSGDGYGDEFSDNPQTMAGGQGGFGGNE